MHEHAAVGSGIDQLTRYSCTGLLTYAGKSCIHPAGRTLLQAGAAAEAKIVQAAAQQGAAAPSVHAALKGGLYGVPGPPAERGHRGGVPVRSSMHSETGLAL